MCVCEWPVTGLRQMGSKVRFDMLAGWPTARLLPLPCLNLICAKQLSQTQLTLASSVSISVYANLQVKIKAFPIIFLIIMQVAFGFKLLKSIREQFTH